MRTTTIIAAVFSMASTALACVDFSVTINNYQYAVGNLKDNGAVICNLAGYGDNTGYNMKCNSGYSARIPNGGESVAYNTPHGDYTFATKITENGQETIGTAHVFC